MLFDLRSAGRRRTVKGVYLGLALLMFVVSGLFVLGAKRYKVRNFIESVDVENLATAPTAG